MQPHSGGMGGCVGCRWPPHSALTWRAGNQSLWCLILSLKIDSSGLFGDCHSATLADPFEVLQHFSGCCESGKADTNAALGNGHRGCGEDDGFVLNGIFPRHPWVSRLWLSVGGFVHTSLIHVHLCLGRVYGSDRFCSIGDALAEHEDGRKRQRGVPTHSSVLWGLDISLAFWVSKLSCWLHPWWVVVDNMSWVPIAALNERHLLPLQPLPTQVISCSVWFVLPTIHELPQS